jgi:hypothetical protein
MDRAELRRFARELGDQLVWWELLPTSDAPSEVELRDLGQLEHLIRLAEAAPKEDDGKLSRLRDLLGDGIPTLIFTVSRDTVRYIRDSLADLRVAWCTGERAGIGTTGLSRDAVLGWFREPARSNIAPRHLVVTDLAAEGLDLQRAARVIHYDLPWTPMRLEQREGRSVRYGSPHSQVETVQFALPPLVERRLRLQASLARKLKLPGTAGLGTGGRHIWRWRTQLSERFRRLPAGHGVASVVCSMPGLLAGFALYRPGDPYPLSATVLWLEPDGGWTEAPETIGAWLDVAATQDRVLPVECAQLAQWLSRLVRPIRDRLDFTRSRRWITPDPTPAARRAMGRLQALAGDAARRHQAKRLAELDRALSFVVGGHTAGEAALVEQVAEVADPKLPGLVGALPIGGFDWSGVEVRLTGLIVFGPSKDRAAEVASSECSAPGPPYSTSTEP